MPTRERSEHYVNNKELLEALVVYRTKVEKSYEKNFGKNLKEQPKEERAKYWEGKPKITNYLGECFLKIATHLSYKPNFVNYMFREDMISDGIENCVQYIHNFDPAKSSNPFAYFTQIIHYAFLRRIQKEKKQLEIKTKIIEKTGYDQVMVVEDGANGTSSDYNSIKEKIHYKLNRQ
jgi:DNA-directed RNA polymerase specialized sigma subunit